MQINLIDETKVNLQEVVQSLLSQKSGTEWAEKTNHLSINYVKHLGEVYGDSWYKGFLPQEFFLDILLPKHGHSEESDEAAFFHLDTTVKGAREYFKNPPEEAKECLDLINYLKQEIKKDGFKTSIVLAVINEKLKHVDGLHRMIALAFLLEEGLKYKPVPVFLCDATRARN